MIWTRKFSHKLYNILFSRKFLWINREFMDYRNCLFEKGNEVWSGMHRWITWAVSFLSILSGFEMNFCGKDDKRESRWVCLQNQGITFSNFAFYRKVSKRNFNKKVIFKRKLVNPKNNKNFTLPLLSTQQSHNWKFHFPLMFSMKTSRVNFKCLSNLGVSLFSVWKVLLPEVFFLR